MLESPAWLEEGRSGASQHKTVALRDASSIEPAPFPQEEATMLIDVSHPEAEKDKSSEYGGGPGENRSGIEMLDPQRATAFSYASIPGISDDERRGLDELFRALPPDVEMNSVAVAMAQTLEELVGVPHEVTWRGAGIARSTGAEFEFDGSIWSWARIPPDFDCIATGVQRGIARRWIVAIDGDQPVVGDQFESGMVSFLVARVFAAFCRQADWPSWVWAVNSLSAISLNAMLGEGKSPLLEIAFDVKFDGGMGSMRALLPMSVINRLQQEQKTDATDRDASVSMSWWGGLSVCRPLVVGATVLRDVEFERLRIGDIIIVERHGITEGCASESARDDGARWMVGADWAVTGRLVAGDDRSWRFEMAGQQIVSSTEEVDVSSENNDDSDSDSGVAIGNAQMELSFRLGAVEMQLDELSRLRPGQIIDCKQPVGSPVELVVRGSPVGSGELVTVEGKLGVRILSLG